MADMFRITPFYFSKLFKQYININFRKYIIQLRIEEAKKMLAYSSQPIVEVAFDTGFQDSNYFSSVFSKYAGMPPRAYRAKYRTKNAV